MMKSIFNKIIFGLIDVFVYLIGFPIMRVVIWFHDKYEAFKGKKNGK